MGIFNRLSVILSVLCLSAGLSESYAGSVEYCNYDGNITWFGTGKSETYNIGTHLSGNYFEGVEIKSLSFPVAVDPEISGFRIWLSESLALDGSNYVPDIVSLDAEVVDGVATVVFTEPYVVPEAGLYAGYSFTVGSRENEVQKKPVAIVSNGTDIHSHGMYVHSSRTYSKWTEVMSDNGTYIPFRMTVSGIADNAVRLALPEVVNGGAGKDILTPVSVVNYGLSEVRSVDMEVFVSGKSCGTVRMDLPESIPSGYLLSQDCEAVLPHVDEIGGYSLEVRVLAVNGVEVSDSHVAETHLDVWSFVPVRRPLVEEYTGTGCGYCPRGGIGFRKMEELFGDRFVGVAYHSMDIMSIFEPEDYPNPAPAIPTSWFDRIKETDPYFGDRISDNVFAVDKVWRERAAVFTPVDLSLNCLWRDDSRMSVDAEASITFVKSYDDCDFRVVYLVVADGLKGSSRRWNQVNTYSGETGIWPSDFDELVNSPNPITDVEYDDVVIMSTTLSDEVFSLPSAIKSDENMIHSVELNLADAVNLSGESLVQDVDRLTVVAIVIDASNGEVLNCVESGIGSSSVSQFDADGIQESYVEYYDLSGMRLKAIPESSPCLVVTVYSDGSRKVSKRF